ncbi:PilX N-terminal domain-containing pilus assembly protein [Rhodanobacter sp. DHG33]|uniref:pilus assembly PilX family protein n=1 Tax=Rhodanobacter sp. DHG33 TaxID=2775921 RepID=UPI001CE15E29|nr:PilX N-terminal domain-containing pilus assembly protein [Rhodanobacter sp. DHG33]
MTAPFRHLASVQHPPQNQRGAVLLVALIFLLLLTMLAISASGRSLLQERMAGGLRNAQQAQMSAENAVRGAEWTLWMNTTNLTGTPLLCGTGIFAGSCYKYDPTNTTLYGNTGTVTQFRHGQGWITSGAATYTGPSGSVNYATSSGTAQLANNPVYIIEDLGVELPAGVSSGLHEAGATGPTGSGYSSTTRHIYRITARATGGNPNTVRVLQSTFAAKGN